MIIITSLMTGLVLFFFLILTLPVLGFFKLTARFRLEKNRKIAHKMIRFLCRSLIFTSGVKLDVRGLENIPEGPVLFVGNHRGCFDVISAYTTIGRDVGFVGKIEFEKIPVFRYWMEMVDGLFLDREDPRQGLTVILNASEKLKAGTSMWIFPEGTRNKGEELMEFKEGSLKPAEKAGCPIVPVAIKGTGEVFEQQFPLIKSNTVHIWYGEPIMLSEIPRPERKGLGAKIRAGIEEQISAMED